MKKFESTLTGENLTRFLNIQETIRMTKRRVSMGGVARISERVHEDILPVDGYTTFVDGSFTLLSLTSVSEDLSKDRSEHRRELEVKRKAEFGFGYRDQRDERSDWMFDELKITSKEPRKKLSRGTESSPCKTVSAGTWFDEANQNPPELVRQDQVEINMRLNEQLSENEEQKIYERICDRYGKESGRRYLLARSMTAPEKKIEAWTTPAHKLSQPQKYSKEMVECENTEIKPDARNFICPDISEDVTKKMQKLVKITPFCSTEGITVKKSWKDVLKKPGRSRKMLHVSVKGKSESSTFGSEEQSDYTPCSCGLFHCDCTTNSDKCKAHKIEKKCDLGNYKVDEINNFLITCREHLQYAQNLDRRTTVLQQHAIKNANRVTRESVYLQSAHDEAESALMTCLMRVMPPQGQEVSDTGFTHVQELANVISEQKMINETEWRLWREGQAKMENVENSDELDSLDSDIVLSETSDALSECNIKLSKGLQPSRIPYFEETFELANTLFDKIDAKINKLVLKNHDKRKMMMEKPYTHMLKERFKFLRYDKKLFGQICRKVLSDEFHTKKLVPFSERKRRKHTRANEMKIELNRKQNQRKLIEGLQLGKRYRRPKRSFLYTEEENYRGFSPRRQKFLLKKGMDKFRKCNLAGRDMSGRGLTKKVIHNDYRLIRRMFDDQLKRNRESLWDPGMMARMEEYMETFREVHKPTEENEEEVEEDAFNVSFGSDQRRPKKDEQKTQTAGPHSWSYCSKSSGNAAETFASMIRSLRSDARAHAGFGVREDSSKFLGAPRTATSFGQSTVQSSSLVSGQPKSGQASSKTYTPPKGRTYTQERISSFGTPEECSSVPQSSNLTRRTLPGKPLAKSTKTLPQAQAIKIMKDDLPHKNPLKMSKSVR